jgi:hypothetical protein
LPPESRLLIVGACPRGLSGETDAEGTEPAEGAADR